MKYSLAHIHLERTPNTLQDLRIVCGVSVAREMWDAKPEDC